MIIETRHDIARKYGYRLRSALDGDFISELKRDRLSHPDASGDDLMKITSDNEIVVYAHDANAYFVANLIRNTPR